MRFDRKREGGNVKLKNALLLLLVTSLLSFSACSLDIPDVKKQAFVENPAAKLFDQAAAAAREPGTLLAGVTVVDVTPRDRLAWLAGFQQMRKSHGVLDPVTARILYLHDGQEALVLISFDFVGLMNADVVRLRSLISADFPGRIQVVTTHNHEGPDTMGYWGPGVFVPVQRGLDQDWLAKSFQDVAHGVNRAIKSAEPVSLATGVSEMGAEWSTNMWFEHGKGPIDRRVSVLRLEKADGTALATVTGWACHAETLLSSTLMSADFPGRFYKYCEAGGGGVGIFLNGALGGMISPRIVRFDQRKAFDFDARVAWMDDLGKALADTALAAVKDSPRRLGEPVALRRAEIAIPMRNGFFGVMFRTGVLSARQEAVDGGVYWTETAWAKIGGAQLALVPGEPFPDLGRKIRAAMPQAEAPFVVGLANDELGYIMLPEQWKDPVYHYETTMSTGPNTGQIIFDALVALLEN
jgi:hypothetical protein